MVRSGKICLTGIITFLKKKAHHTERKKIWNQVNQILLSDLNCVYQQNLYVQLIIISGNAEWLDRGDPTVAANGESEGGWGTASAWCPVSCLSERLQSWAVCSQVALPTQGVYCILFLDWTSLLQGNSLMMNFTATEKEKLKEFTSWAMVHFHVQPISWVPPKKAFVWKRKPMCQSAKWVN